MDGSTATPPVYVSERNTKHLLIWFGGFFEPPIPKHLDALGYSSLNLLDTNRDWYTGGVSGLTSNEEETAEWLAGMVQGRAVICGGQSSGGYAAIRYGHALNAALIVAISPQTGVRTSACTSAAMTSLDRLYTLEPRDHPISIHVARSERHSAQDAYWGDHLHAQAMAHVANVTIHQHPYDSHVLTNFLGQTRSFLDVVKHDMLWHGLSS